MGGGGGIIACGLGFASADIVRFNGGVDIIVEANKGVEGILEFCCRSWKSGVRMRCLELEDNDENDEEELREILSSERVFNVVFISVGKR